MKKSNPVQRIALSATVLLAAGMGLTTEVFARAEWAAQLQTGCDSCHNGANGTGDNVMPAAKNAYKSGGVVPGLKNFITAAAPGAPNSKPVLNGVAPQWDVAANEPITIPLIINDAEGDAVNIINKAKVPAGAAVADGGVDSATQLPKWDFKWTPTDAQKNKIYTVKFAAKETDTTKKFTSNTITAKIRVWPAGDKDQATVNKLIVTTASWKSDTLTLKGKVVPNKILTASEKIAFLARTDLAVDIAQGADTTGAAIATQLPISLKPNGTWTLTQPLVAPFSCNVTLSFEGKNATRKIAKAPSTCLK